MVHCLAHKHKCLCVSHHSHFFCIQKDEPDAFKELGTGNRIATWLFYVSNLTHLTQYLCLFMFGTISLMFKISKYSNQNSKK